MNLNKKTLVLIIIFISTNSYSGINDKQKTVIESQLFLLNEGMVSKKMFLRKQNFLIIRVFLELIQM